MQHGRARAALAKGAHSMGVQPRACGAAFLPPAPWPLGAAPGLGRTLPAVGPMWAAMDSVTFLVNPWELPVPFWLGGVVVKELLLQSMDLAVRLIGRHVKPLPSRTGPKPVYQRPLDTTDVLYLSMNAVIETIYTSHLLHLLWFSPGIDRPISKLGLLNGPVALWLLVFLNDAIYAPAHRALHHPLLYRWIHKHHHRVTYPQRGNVDARNEHPLEQIMFMLIWWHVVKFVISVSGVHAVCIPLHITLMVVVACFNHTAIDLSFTVLGIDFSVRSHEMHHRKPDTNFGQVFMFWDRLMGTYVPYSHHEA